MTVIGGNDDRTYEVCEEFGFKKYITVAEMLAVMPELAPLSTKSGFPLDKDRLLERLNHRLGDFNKDRLMQEHFKSIFIMANPHVYEAHIQIFSDLLISKDGKLGS